MAGNAAAFLQVSPFSLAGVDTTNRKTVVEGPILFAIAPGSLLTAVIAVAGTGYAANDTVAVAGGTGGVIKVLTVSSGVPQTISISANGSGYAAVTGAATTAIIGSGTGLTVTTTVNTGDIVQLLSWSITSNVLTFTTPKNTLTTGGGQTLIVQNFPSAVSFLNGSYTTSSATATTVVVPLTHANGSGSQQGIGVVQPTYTTGGVPLSWFLDLLGNPNPIGTIGPLAKPTWFEAQSVAGSAFNYKVNLTVTPPTLLIFNGVTQLSDQGTITADTITFRAEFVKNAF
jgi:hypothetical protein